MAWRGGFSGKGYDIGTFKTLLDSYPAVPFANFIVIHNTDALIDKMRAYGEKHGYSQRIKNLEHYYKNEKKWSSGPHGFIEPDGKFYPGTPLNQPGTGSPSWNGSAWHLEMEADFDVDDPTSGLGLLIVEMTAHITALLLRKQKMEANNSTVRFHKEDPATTHNCPGPKLRKDWFLAKVQSYMDGDKPVDLSYEARPPVVPGAQPAKPPFETKDVQAHLTRLGYDVGGVDGIFGPKTELAVKSFQKAMGVVQTGVVGPWLWQKLRTLQEPSKPPVASEGYIPVEDLHPSEFAIGWMKRFEGLRLEPYDDRGSLAIGYGHNSTSNRPPKPVKGMKITIQEADKILHDDAEAIAGEVRKVLKGKKLKQGQFDALVLHNFQMGQTQFTRTKAVQALLNDNHESAVLALMVEKANATADKGLRRRRLIETQIFNGEYPTKW
jgi:peptidoglycan hydrolase-like protein with peptidoglycan-binding domain